jgi:hypothetical protein
MFRESATPDKATLQLHFLPVSRSESLLKTAIRFDREGQFSKYLDLSVWHSVNIAECQLSLVPSLALCKNPLSDRLELASLLQNRKKPGPLDTVTTIKRKAYACRFR